MFYFSTRFHRTSPLYIKYVTITVYDNHTSIIKARTALIGKKRGLEGLAANYFCGYTIQRLLFFAIWFYFHSGCWYEFTAHWYRHETIKGEHFMNVSSFNAWVLCSCWNLFKMSGYSIQWIYWYIHVYCINLCLLKHCSLKSFFPGSVRYIVRKVFISPTHSGRRFPMLFKFKCNIFSCGKPPKMYAIKNDIISSETKVSHTCEISSSDGGEYDVQNCLLGCAAL
jgi:hypothetical protein